MNTVHPVPADWQAIEGAPNPLGVTYVAGADAYNFAIYAKHARRVTLLLFAAEDVATPVIACNFEHGSNRTGRVWHARLPGETVRRALYYGYRIDGPLDGETGHRFDPDKLLVDPYARAIYFPPEFSREAARRPGSNMGRAPLGILSAEAAPFDWGDDRPPRRTHDAVIYELHVRGFTRRASSGVPADRRGTFAGVIDKIDHLRRLGVTVVELMPVFQFDPLEGNYWGYMPMSFFAVHDSYGSRHALGEELDELRRLIKALHAAGIEVILDVVFNHTAEGNEAGPTYSFRGIDNTTYYLLNDDRSGYRNDSGTGNVLHTANRYVQTMILDSLRYWVREFHVDGFRFDLASLFTRRSDGSINLEDPPIVSAIEADPDLAHVRLIAEAWDLSSYQLGRAFPGVTWLQWNGRFRDDIRRFVRGDAGQVGAAVRRVYGSDDLFPDTPMDAYHPYQSVNFATCHDGFSLYDLVAYDRKHNDANGHENHDGTDANWSWNCGWEGDDGAPEHVLALRRRQARNIFALLMLSNGTPMFRAGDEFLATQNGNNNPYNQDNETSWLDWDLAERNGDFLRFCRMMIAFRRAHPGIARSRFWRSDVRWYGDLGPLDLGPDVRWFAWCLDGRAAGDEDLYVMVNMDRQDRWFDVQETGRWRRVVDTGLLSPEDIVCPARAPLIDGPRYPVAARSVVVLLGRRAG
ncbi:MAG: glycogen debranching protein [Alphaproteobacteria bacterium]